MNATIKITNSEYYKNRKRYELSGIKKCSGFYDYWFVNIKAFCPSGVGYFVIARYIYANKNGKSYFTNQSSGIEIKKHCKNGWEAKRVMKFLYDYPVDYVDNIRETKNENSKWIRK